jgi:hypothetical protein
LDKIKENDCLILNVKSLLKADSIDKNDDIKNPEFMKDEKDNNLI